MSPTEPGVGSAADEAARLADALGGWFRCAATDSPDESSTPSHDPLTCRACPLCRGIAAVRSVRPEVIEHLATAADALAAALRELGALRAPGGRQPESADRAGPTYPDRPETEHIVIADDDQDEGVA